MSTRGTVHNCGTGNTPRGTLLTGEENWAAFFACGMGDNTLRSAKEDAAFACCGKALTGAAGLAQVYAWDTEPGGDERFARFNASVTGVDATQDYRNEFYCRGCVTWIDPYNATSVVKKRTTLGRMAHEGAACRAVAGQKLAVYMGDDVRGACMYKFVSAQVWVAADANASDRLAVGNKYLDNGKLYAARFNDDCTGTGTGVELSMTHPDVANYACCAFADNGDVLI